MTRKYDLPPPYDGEMQIERSDGIRLDLVRTVFSDRNVRIVDGVCLNVTRKTSQMRMATQIASEHVPLTKFTNKFIEGNCDGVVPVAHGLWIDIVHGGYPNLWTDLCHWTDTMFPLFLAARDGLLDEVTDVFMWQVSRARFSSRGFRSALLKLVLAEAKADAARVHFDEDVPIGQLVRFARFTTANFILPRLDMASHFIGCARGLGDVSTRLHYRRRTLRLMSLQIPAYEAFRVLYIRRSRIDIANASRAASVARRGGFSYEVRSFSSRDPYRLQVEVLTRAHVLMASHGASLVHTPLLQPFGAIVELVECHHSSMMYRNLAMYSGVGYEPVYASESCRFGNTDRVRASTREYLFRRVDPLPFDAWSSALMRAMRYVRWGASVAKE